MDEDPWDIKTNHLDAQYEQLRLALPALGPFRAPRDGDSDTFQGVLIDLQDFMSRYPFCFPEFVEDYISNSATPPARPSPPSAGTGRQLRRMVQPLFKFSKFLEDGLQRARDMMDHLEEAHKLEASLEAIKVEGAPPSSRPSESERLPAKRTSEGEDGSDMVKRLRAVAEPALRVSRPLLHTSSSTSSSSTSSPFAHSPFSRTSSAASDASAASRSTTTSTSTTATTTPMTSVESSTNSMKSGKVEAETVWQPVPIREANERLIHIIAPTPYQAVLNKIGVRFHTQWELERLIAQSPHFTWDDVHRSDLDCLGGTAYDAASSVERMIAAVEQRTLETTFSAPVKALSERRTRLLHEVDDEETSIMANDLRGVGNDSVHWPYGGKIAYCIVVQPLAKGREDTFIRPASTSSAPSHSTPSQSKQSLLVHSRGTREPVDPAGNPFRSVSSSASTEPSPLPFEMHLRAPDMPGKSFRLARRFGSRRVITFKLKECRPSHRDGLLNLFRGRVFVLFGKPFRAMWADGESVHAIETSDVVEPSKKRRLSEEPLMPDFFELFAMYNQLSQKPNQAMAKWAARPQILFSDSVPAAQVDPSAITVVPDIVTKAAALAGRASTEQTLTDGCGLMSETLARRIYHHPSLQLHSGVPSVVQIRVGGSKGLLALMSPAQSLMYEGKEVVLRDSMVKALPASEYATDPSLLTVDVLRCESLRISTTISSEAIIAMTHGGVPPSVFVKMAEDGLDELRNDLYPHPLEGETEDQALLRLASSIYRRGGISAEKDKRRLRSEGKSAQVAGPAKKSSADTVDIGDEEDPLGIDASERFDVDPVSGQPGSIAECLFEAVSNGVDPATSHFAGDKIHHLADVYSGKMIKELKIPVEQSLSAFIVPDTLGILAPDEIFIAFSGRGPVHAETGRPMPYLEGSCLAFRSPCKLPTDVRKLKAVWKPELAHLTDCIVMSANSDLCDRSPASFLGGGDYDGDTAQLFWGAELVEHFSNANEAFAEVPEDFVRSNFDKQVVSGSEFLEALEGADEETVIGNMQYWLLGGMLNNDATSDYSNFHGNAVYSLGCDHPETIRLARMFCHVLDARKSGLKIKKEVKSSDAQRYGGGLAWRSWKKGLKVSVHNMIVVSRGKGLGRFVMDILIDAGRRKQQEIMADFPKTITPPSLKDYTDLRAAWARESQLAKAWPDQSLAGQLIRLQSHVEICYVLWQRIDCGRLDSKSSVEEMYMVLLAGGEVAQTPRKKKTPHASAEQAKAKAAEMSLDRLSQIRQLAAIWRDQPDRSDIPLLSMRGERFLRVLKISCAAEMPERTSAKATQKFPFDVDFITTCAMKAEASGRAVATSLRIAQDTMKPAYRRV